MMQEEEFAFPSFLPPQGGMDPDVYPPATPAPCAGKRRSSFKLERTPLNRQNKEAELWEPRLIMKSSLVSKLIECDEIELAGKLDRCHTEKVVQICKSCESVHSYWNHCHNWICPVCAASMATQRRTSIEWWSSQIKQPKHVVLTVRSFPVLSQNKVKWLRECFNKLRRSSLGREWSGGCYSLEATHGEPGWHLHIHALVDCRWIDSHKLSAKWNQVTGGNGYVVKVKDVREKSYLAEITKYACKPAELIGFSPQLLWEFIHAFSGLKQFTVFGSLRGQRQAWRAELERRKLEHRTCECGGTEFWYMTEMEYEAWSIIHQANVSPRPPPRPSETQKDFLFASGLDIIYKD